MNKYQEAIKNVRLYHQDFTNGLKDDDIETLQELVDMQEVIEKVADSCKKITELSVPRKPIKSQEYSPCYLCPSCKKEIYWDTDYGQQHFNYCTECGQALDWNCK